MLKKLFSLLTSLFILGLLLAVNKVNAQEIKVNIIAAGYHGNINVFDPAVNYDPEKFMSIIHPDKMGAASYTTNLTKPGYIVLYFNLPGFMQFQYSLFLSPGDDLLFKIQFVTNTPVAISMSGKGSNNNQPEIFALTYIDLLKFKEDSTPDRAITAIKNQEEKNQIVLKQYIEQYKPSANFIENARLNNQYFALNTYYSFYHSGPQPFVSNSNYKKWQGVEDSLMARHKLNNDSALGAYNYNNLIQTFLIQEPPILINKEIKEPVTFYRDWYHTTVDEGKKIYTDERKMLFYESIINKYFTGNTAELAYAQLFRFHLHFKHYEDIDIVFEHFKNKYPSSIYIPIFSKKIDEIVAQKKQVINNNMVFVADDGTTLNTMEDVLQLMKGRTVFVDMWGTWCSPCRVELEKYTPQIRTHFKGKNVTFLYIDNKDTNHKEEWKKVIAYYKIEGVHILANEQLDKDIMTKLKSTGYPTHFIIKKDGSFVKTKIQDESNTEELIKEIEAVL
jgi:thiol-disulfide isomerase/thioredoxin